MVECNEKYTFISIEIPRDTYFLIMEACLITRETMDEFIIGAALNEIKRRNTVDKEQSDKFTDEGDPNEPLTRRKKRSKAINKNE